MKPLNDFDWSALEIELNAQGQAILPALLSADECDALMNSAADDAASSQAVRLETLDLGRGEQKFFGAALPAPLEQLRRDLYARLAPIAGRWSEVMGLEGRYPGDLDSFLKVGHRADQRRPQSAVSKLREGDYVALHQNAEGEKVFPLQAVVLLSEPGTQFSGGELAMTEQRPRMQSRPMVVPLRRGDAVVFAVQYRPFKGTKGFYRVNLKHAVSRVRSGERIAVELLLHDAR